MEKSSDNTNKQSEQTEKLVKYISSEFDKYEKFHTDRFEKARRIVKKWAGDVPDEVSSDWENRIHVPMMFEAEQTITPRVFTALFPTDAPLDVKTEGDTPAEDGIIIKSLIQHFFRVSDVRAKSNAMLTQNTLLGTAYADAGSWLTRRGYVLNEDGSRVHKIVDNRPDFQSVDYFEMYPHPQKKHMSDPLPLMRRRWVDEETLKFVADNPFFKMDNLKLALDSKPDIQEDNDYEDTRNRYEVIDYWGPWDYKYTANKDGNESEITQKAVPFWAIVINRKICVRQIPNPYNHQIPPFVKTIMYPDVTPNWFGVGVGQIGLSTQERLNKLVNQRLNNVDLILNRQGCYNGNDPLLNSKLLQTSKPGKWYKVSDTVTSMRWMDTPDVTASSYREEAIAKADFRESVGATAALQPTETGQDSGMTGDHRTAQGMQMLQGAAGIRFKPVLTQLEQDFIAQTANFYFSNCKQFMVEKEWVEVMGEGASKMVEISPDQIQRRARFIPTGISETVNKEIQIGQLLRYKEVTINDPTINRAELNKRIAELFGFKDIQKIIIAPQQPQQGAPGQSGMSPDQEAMIKQRIQEGASPDQIKMEMLGPPPSEGQEMENG